MSKKFIPLFCILLVYAVNTERHQYVDIEDYPYHVSIRIAGRHVCSGAFIHESWIMTAASCVFSAKLSTISVRVRSSYISTGGDILEISNVVVHENFDKYMYFNDIALMKLKDPAEYGEKLLPIGLPEKEDEVQDGKHCVVTGWKRTLGTSSTGAQLTAAAVAIVNQRTCKMPTYKPLSKEMLCAANVTHPSETCQGSCALARAKPATILGDTRESVDDTEERHLDLIVARHDTWHACGVYMHHLRAIESGVRSLGCQAQCVLGDLGAPLVSEQTLIGILSYGLGCEIRIHPGVYTRISSYLSWIFVHSGIH